MAYQARLDRQWEVKFEALMEYRRQHGHCNVPQSSKKQHPVLGKWVREQRSKHKKGRLLKERLERLEAVGFRWDPREQRQEELQEEWEERFQELKDHLKSKCTFYVGKKDNPRLKFWINTQRVAYRENTMKEDRMNKLEKIGFPWVAGGVFPPAHLQQWEEKFHELLEYVKRTGSFCVGQRENPKLAKWIYNQRQCHRYGTMKEEKATRLNGIGFPWDNDPGKSALDELWEERLQELKDHVVLTGSFHIREKGNQRLYSWVKKQRASYRDGWMRDDRMKRLNDIGFPWETVGKKRKVSDLFHEALSKREQAYPEEPRHYKDFNPGPLYTATVLGSSIDCYGAIDDRGTVSDYSKEETNKISVQEREHFARKDGDEESAGEKATSKLPDEALVRKVRRLPFSTKAYRESA